MCDDPELQWLAIISFGSDRICPCVDHIAGDNFGIPCRLPESEFNVEPLLQPQNGATRTYRFPSRVAAEGFARSISPHFRSAAEFAGTHYHLALIGVAEGVVGRDGHALLDRAGPGKSNGRGLSESPCVQGSRFRHVRNTD